MDFASRLQREYEAEWKDAYLDLDGLLHGHFTTAPGERQPLLSPCAPNASSPKWRQTFEQEVARVEDFYHYKLDEVTDLHAQLQAQCDRLAREKRIAREQASNHDSKILRWVARQIRTGSLRSDWEAAEDDLKLATYTIFRKLRLLQHFAELNDAGFRNVAYTCRGGHRSQDARDCIKILEKRDFSRRKDIKAVGEDLTELYCQFFCRNDRLRALRDLHPKDRTRTGHFCLWRAGLRTGIGAMLVCDGIRESLKHSTRQRIPNWPALLQIYGALALPVVLSMLLVIDLAVWQAYKINYILMFRLDRRTYLGNMVFAEVPATWFAFLSLCFWLSWRPEISPYVLPTSLPLVFLLGTALWLLLPAPVLRPSARWWLVRSFTRTLLAGAIALQFRDFWLGDMMTSLNHTFSQVGFGVCAYRHGWKGDMTEICSPNASGWTPFLVVVPYIIRALQSLRRYRDMRKTLHLGNALKACVSIAHYIIYYGWRRHDSPRNGLFALWVTFAVLNALYSGLWDILVDWNLWPRLILGKDKHTKDAYARWTYAPAAAANSLLRFSWLIYLSPVPSDALKSFINAMFEALRRLLWNLYRLEAEQLGNVDSYQAVASIDFPYDLDTK